MILGGKFRVYLHFTPLFTSRRKHEPRRGSKQVFVNWAVSNYHLRVGLRRTIRLQKMLQSLQNLC